MKKSPYLLAILFIYMACSTSNKVAQPGKWISLFDGKSLDGWKISENPATFSI